MLATRHAPLALICFALLLQCCSGDSSGGARSGQGPQASAQLPVPQNAAGTSGDFGNASQPPLAGSAAAVVAGPRPSCQGGRYSGTYKCDLEVFIFPAELEGEVSFSLETAKTARASDCQEFCPDLVIAEGSGTFFGLAGDTGWGFESKLDGGLDCSTGEFRATVSQGVYGLAGSDDPNDPNALTTVVEPSLGEFEGTFSGMHSSGPPEGIAGDWNLADAADLARCSGPFTVELQP